MDALESVRVDALTIPTLRLHDAEQCVAFVSRLFNLCASAAANHLGLTVTIV